MNAVCRLFAFGALMTAASCSPEAGSSDATPLSRLPVLEAMPSAALDSLGPERAISAGFAVARDGRIAFTGGYDPQERVITIIDTLGHVERVGRKGQGPGEFERFLSMAFVGPDDALLVYDQVQARVVRVAGNTATQFADLKIPPGFPVSIFTDSLDVTAAELGDMEGGHLGIARVSMATSVQRMIVPPTDSAYVALMNRAPTRSRFPMVASHGDRIVVANQYSFSFQSFDATGRPLQSWGRHLPVQYRSEATLDSMIKAMGPRGGTGTTPGGNRVTTPTPAQYRKMLSEEAQRYFSTMKFDDSGRLWVFGRAETGNSFADIYADTTYLGRRELPCSMAQIDASLRGTWLAVLCSAPQTDAGIQLKLFRVTEAARK